MDLEIILSFHGDVPIYEQIETQIREGILNGSLPPGSAIPSMRTLAKMLKVSVITVQKAYENLKTAGLIVSAVGRGTVVAAMSREALTESRRQELEEALQHSIQLAKSCNLSAKELLDLLALLCQEDDYA